jgi:hypothetical protein
MATDMTKCDACGHEMDEHGPSGCAADDEAAMGGCFCTVAVERPKSKPLSPIPGPGGTFQRSFA